MPEGEIKPYETRKEIKKRKTKNKMNEIRKKRERNVKVEEKES